VEFDFDQWRRLARDDPQEFERRRAAAIEELIARATPPQQPRLRDLQARIDRERREAGTPLAAAARLQGMLADQLVQLRQAFEQLGERSRERAPETRGKQGRVLPFTRRD
jgi:hypothetical protein